MQTDFADLFLMSKVVTLDLRENISGEFIATLQRECLLSLFHR